MSGSALQPAVANPSFPESSYEEAVQMTKEYIRHIEAHSPTLGVSLSKWVATWLEEKLHTIRMDSVYLHRFHSYQGAVRSLLPWCAPDGDLTGVVGIKRRCQRGGYSAIENRRQGSDGNKCAFA